MKVGVISHGSPDYLVDIVTDGLIRLLGRHSVSLDYNVRGGWGGPFSHLLQGFQGPEPFDIHEAEVLVASNRSANAMRDWMKKTGKTKVAFLDGEDQNMVMSEQISHVKVYFKREFIPHHAYDKKIRPLPFAAIPEALVDGVEVTRQVFYSGHVTHPFRAEVARILAEMGFPEAANQEKSKYNLALMSSLIGVAVRGNGWDTYRYWEIPYFGAALLSQRPGIVIPGNFEDGKEAVFYDGVGDLKRKLREMLLNVERTIEIAKAGRKACLERHMSVHRAQTVLDALA